MSIARVCFRAIQRDLRALERAGRQVPVLAPIDSRDVGRLYGPLAMSELSADACAAMTSAAMSDDTPPMPELWPMTQPPEAIRRIVRQFFRGRASSKEEVDHRLDAGMEFMRAMASLRARAQLTASGSVVEDIPRMRVDAESVLVQSLPGGGSVHAYRIQVANLSSCAVRVKGRHWQIWAGSRGEERTRLYAEVPHGSPGVVGKEPVLEPGEYFHYVSTCSIPGKRGWMIGSLEMEEVHRSNAFEVHVPAFPLGVPPEECQLNDGWSA